MFRVTNNLMIALEALAERSATQRTFCLATTILLTALQSVSASGAEPSRLILNIDGPTVIGVFPPVSQAEIDHDDGGLREGMAHVQFAIEDLVKCLTPRKVRSQFANTRSIEIRDGRDTRTISFSRKWEGAVGIVLVAPGRAPITVLATGGPSSLIETAPQAAWRYFSEPACKRYEEQTPPKHTGD